MTSATSSRGTSMHSVAQTFQPRQRRAVSHPMNRPRGCMSQSCSHHFAPHVPSMAEVALQSLLNEGFPSIAASCGVHPALTRITADAQTAANTKAADEEHANTHAQTFLAGFWSKLHHDSCSQEQDSGTAKDVGLHVDLRSVEPGSQIRHDTRGCAQYENLTEQRPTGQNLHVSV